MGIIAELGNKFSTLDDKLRFLSRQIQMQQKFLKDKFQGEFEEFVETQEREEASGSSDSVEEDMMDVSVAAGAGSQNSGETYGLEGTSSTNRQDEQGDDFEEEKFHPLGFVEPVEPQHSEFSYAEFVNAMRLVNSEANANEEIPSDLQISTSPKSPFIQSVLKGRLEGSSSGVTSTAAIPSSSSNGSRRLQQKKRVDEECGENLPSRPCPMELRNRRSNATEREGSPITKGTVDCDFGNVGGSDEETLRRGIGFGTRRTRLLRRKEPTLGESSTLRAQMKRNRQKEKRFKCSVCGKRFLTATHRRDHELIHTNQKPHGCSFCEKSFRRLGTLRDHQLIHTNEKPHECSVCGKSFRRLGHLRSHKFSHTGEKPHKCAFCSKSFADRTRLQRHEEKHPPPL